MLRDRRAAGAKIGGDLADGAATAAQQAQDFAPSRMAIARNTASRRLRLAATIIRYRLVTNNVTKRLRICQATWQISRIHGDTDG